MKEPDLKALIDYRLGEAHEALRDAELLWDAKRYRAAANRLYYAAFYAASDEHDPATLETQTGKLQQNKNQRKVE